MEYNILNLYPFKEDSDIFVYGKDKIDVNKKYDYIAFIGCLGKELKLLDALKNYEKYLKPDGIFLIAVDNKFGIRFFAGNPENIYKEKFIGLDGYSKKEDEIETYTKNSIEEILKPNGYNYNFYYLLPDYNYPNVIFSDKSLPDYNTFDKYLPYYEDNSSILFDELKVFREILKADKEQFSFFVNSFFVEISKSKLSQKYNYISINNIRKPEYQLVTKITDDFAEKTTAVPEAKNHLNMIIENIDILKKQGLNVLDYAEKDIIKSKDIKQELRLDNVLIKTLNEDIEKGKAIIDRYFNIINQDTYQETDYNKTIFAKYGIEIENTDILKNMHFLKNGLWDMIFQNCFYFDDDFYFFDQEWREEALPIEYIYYRAIYYFIPYRNYLYSDNWLSEKFEIRKYISIFEKLDEKIQRSLYDEKMWDVYHKDKFFDIDATNQELINVNKRLEATTAAFENLKKENEQIKSDYESLKKSYLDYLEKIHNSAPYKVYSKFKNIKKTLLGGKNE